MPSTEGFCRGLFVLILKNVSVTADREMNPWKEREQRETLHCMGC